MRFQSLPSPYIFGLSAGLATVLLTCCLPLYGSAQELEEDPAVPASNEAVQPVNNSPQRGENGRFVLQGSIQTLEAAISAEKDSVDWYNWYLNARKYISKRGGLACPSGTLLTFKKNGQVEAKTLDPRCLLSIEGMNYPLPQNTVLDAVILPVRSSILPPATPTEIYQRTNGFQ